MPKTPMLEAASRKRIPTSRSRIASRKWLKSTCQPNKGTVTVLSTGVPVTGMTANAKIAATSARAGAAM